MNVGKNLKEAEMQESIEDEIIVTKENFKICENCKYFDRDELLCWHKHLRRYSPKKIFPISFCPPSNLFGCNYWKIRDIYNQENKTIWNLKFTYKNGRKHDHLSWDIKYLQEMLTLILRRDGHGIIIKGYNR